MSTYNIKTLNNVEDVHLCGVYKMYCVFHPETFYIGSASISKGRKYTNIECSLKFPDHKTIINAVANSIFDKKSFVCFNPKWIQIAAKIFPSENLICRFYENNEMMVFFPSGEAKGFLGIMPMKLTEEEAVLDFSLS